jgi:hypothetical protein
MKRGILWKNYIIFDKNIEIPSPLGIVPNTSCIMRAILSRPKRQNRQLCG